MYITALENWVMCTSFVSLKRTSTNVYVVIVMEEANI